MIGGRSRRGGGTWRALGRVADTSDGATVKQVLGTYFAMAWLAWVWFELMDFWQQLRLGTGCGGPVGVGVE